MLNDYWLKEGEQMRTTELVKKHAEIAHSLKTDVKDYDGEKLPDSLISAYSTARYINDRIPRCGKAVDKNEVFRKRTADQTISEGYFPTCSDTGLLFRALMIAQGIPTSYIETFHEDTVLDILPDGQISAHVLARVFEGNMSYIVDPTAIRYFRDEQEMFKRSRYVICAEGLDSWDMGIRGFDDLRKFKEANTNILLERYVELLSEDTRQKIEKVISLRR